MPKFLYMNVLKNIFLLLVLSASSVFSQNYEITVAINTRHDTVLLGSYYVRRDRPRVNDTIVLRNGSGVFRSDRELPNGVYFLASDGKLLFDFIVGDNKRFGIVADTADFINLTSFTNSPDNDVYFGFRRLNIELGRQQQQLSELFRNAASDEERSEIINRQRTLQRESLERIDDMIADNSHLYVSKILKSEIPVQARIPEPPRDAAGNITDPTYQYRWWRRHFFDNLNIFDPDMMRTPSYEDKLFEYITRVIPQHSDTICAEIDKMLLKAQQTDENVFRFIMGTLFNHFLESTDLVRDAVVPENVWACITENWYIPYAHWATEETIENLKKEINDIKPNLIGNRAPPMEMLKILPPDHFRVAAMDTAIKFDPHAGRTVNDFRTDNELKSKFTVLYFWDFTCGHCRSSIQELFNIWENNKDKGLQVINVQTYYSQRQDKGRWIDFVNEQNLFGVGWFNTWSPYNHEFRRLYNTATVPTIYLLNENFDILLRGNTRRGIGVETIKDFFDRN